MQEESASGIDVEENELDELLEEILEKEKLGKEQVQLDSERKKNKAEKEKLTAETMRKEAMNRMAKKSRRSHVSDLHDDEDDVGGEPATRRVRRSANDVAGYLRERSEKEYTLKMEEISLRRIELERTDEREKAKTEHQKRISQQQQDTMLAILKQIQQQQQSQQNLQAMLVAQQQQQNQILMALINKNEKN